MFVPVSFFRRGVLFWRDVYFVHLSMIDFSLSRKTQFLLFFAFEVLVRLVVSCQVKQKPTRNYLIISKKRKFYICIPVRGTTRPLQIFFFFPHSRISTKQRMAPFSWAIDKLLTTEKFVFFGVVPQRAFFIIVENLTILCLA